MCKNWDLYGKCPFNEKVIMIKSVLLLTEFAILRLKLICIVTSKRRHAKVTLWEAFANTAIDVNTYTARLLTWVNSRSSCLESTKTKTCHRTHLNWKKTRFTVPGSLFWRKYSRFRSTGIANTWTIKITKFCCSSYGL